MNWNTIPRMNKERRPRVVKYCAGCRKVIGNNSLGLCAVCSKQCNVCQVRFLRADMIGGCCVDCRKVWDMLVAAHKGMHVKDDPERERRVVLYASRFDAGQDIWTGKSLTVGERNKQ